MVHCAQNKKKMWKSVALTLGEETLDQPPILTPPELPCLPFVWGICVQRSSQS